MDITADYHTHTLFSDGSASVDTMVATAAEKGLKTIGITDHMPLPYTTRYAMDIDHIHGYRDRIRKAGHRHRDRIRVLSGLEMEYSPDLTDWIKPLADMGWDHLIVSVHGLFAKGVPYLVNGNEKEFHRAMTLGFEKDIRALCRLYYTTLQQAFETGWFDAAGHLDVVKKHGHGLFDESEPWYMDLVTKTLDVLKDQGMKMEINTSGLNQPSREQYPSTWIIRAAVQKKIPLILSSDSHRPDTLGQYFELFSAGLGCKTHPKPGITAA